MENIQFRPLAKTDYVAYIRLINDAWNTDDYIKNPAILNAALDAYMRLGLLGATYALVAEKDNKVLGIIVASVKRQRKISGFFGTLSHIGALVRTAARLPFCSRSDRRKLYAYMSEFAEHKKLLGDKKNRYDSSIDFLVMARESRDLGIGKALLGKVFEYFRDCGAKYVHLFTDTWCNYGFYDSQGFTLAANCDVPSEEGTAALHKMFLYEKEV